MKKKGQKPKMLVTYAYKNIGMVDEGYKVDPDGPRGAASAFSLENQTRELQRKSSQMRIAKLRKAYGGILQTESISTEDYDNPFMGLARDQAPSALSLSVYNKPDMLARPRTAHVNIYQGVKGLEPPKVDEDGNPIIIEEEPVDERLPQFEAPKISTLEMPEDLGYVNVCTAMPRTNTELSRLEQLNLQVSGHSYDEFAGFMRPPGWVQTSWAQAAHDGAWLRSIRGFGKWAGPGRLAFPYGLGADAKGRLLVTETKRVIVLTPQGEQMQSLPLPECGALSGIDGGPSHVYVADSSNEQVLVYDTVL